MTLQMELGLGEVEERIVWEENSYNVDVGNLSIEQCQGQLRTLGFVYSVDRSLGQKILLVKISADNQQLPEYKRPFDNLHDGQAMDDVIAWRRAVEHGFEWYRVWVYQFGCATKGNSRYPAMMAFFKQKGWVE